MPTTEEMIQNLRNSGLNDAAIAEVMAGITAPAEYDRRIANPVPEGTVNPNTGTWRKIDDHRWAVAVEDAQIGQTVTVRTKAGKEKKVTIGSLILQGSVILGIPTDNRPDTPQRRARASARRYGTSYTEALRDEL